jgi:hypothetical protein
LNSGINEIRLVTILPTLETGDASIECCLSHTPLDDAPDYEALSYTWADSSGDTSLSCSILLGGAPFLVGRNLEAALQQLRLPSNERIIWIDAICIDQKADSERSNQVAMMRTIYQRASRVIIWLGIEESYSGYAIEFLHGVLGRADAEEWVRKVLTSPDHEFYLIALRFLFIRPYWYRIWIVQEVVSAREIIVSCGSSSISWASLIKARDYLMKQIMIIGRSRITNADFARAIHTEGPQIIRKAAYHPPQTLPDLLEMLLHCRKRTSTDPRDKVYGIAGLTSARDDPKFTLDYSKTVQKVYTDVVEYVVTTTRDLRIISVGKHKFHPDWLPSWVPDWSKSSLINRRMLRSKNFNAALGSQADAKFDSAGRVLRVKGICASELQSVAISLNFAGTQHLHEGHSLYHILFAICDWHELAIKTTGDETNQQKAFHKVIFMNPYANDRDILPEALDIDGAKLLECFTAVIARFMPEYPLYGMLRNAQLRYQNAIPKDHRNDALQRACIIVKDFAESMKGRRFFTSSTGQMGIAPYSAEIGDIVSILLGSPYPVILRPHEGYYTVIGEAYAYGLMHGEAMEKLAAGEYKLQEFELH